MPLSHPVLMILVFVLLKEKLDIVVQQFGLGKYCLKYLQHSEFLMPARLVEGGRCTSLKRKLELILQVAQNVRLPDSILGLSLT